MSFLSDYTEKNSNLIPQIDIPCFAWNSQAEQGFLFFKAKSLSYFHGKTQRFGNYLDFGRRMIDNERKRVNMPAC